MNNDLPYTFDLFFDIKTREQLLDEVIELENRLKTIKDIMAKHNISFTEDELRRDQP